MDDFRAVDGAQLHVLVNRLQRYELDFEHRLTNRFDTVRELSDPLSDSALRRMSYTLDRLKAQRSKAQRELSRRAMPA